MVMLDMVMVLAGSGDSCYGGVDCCYGDNMMVVMGYVRDGYARYGYGAGW